VDQYPDVFPKELLGMPPDRDTEFVIELIPGTVPIYKRPYRMPDKQLVELKEQIQELQGKGYIRPSSSTWVAPMIFILKKDGTQRMCIDYRFLGHVISELGISVERSKIEDALNWITPTSVSDIRSFLGLAGYYRRFIDGFSKISNPMTELLGKDKKVEWSAM
jgi:hypothetical protein